MTTSKIRSPYKAGQVITQLNDLYGRKEDIERLDTWIFQASSNHVQVVGERKFGKTSFLRTFINEARPQNTGTLLVYSDISRFVCHSWVDFYSSILRETHERLLEQDFDLADRVVQELSRLYLRKPPFEIDHDFGEYVLQNKLDEHVVLGIFGRYFRALKRCNCPTVFFLDELGYALRHFKNDDLHFSHLRELAMEKEKYDVTVVVADRRSHQDIAPERDASPGLNFITQTLRIGLIDEDEALRLIVEPSLRALPPVKFTSDEIAFMLRKAGRQPFLLQLIAEKFYLLKASGKSIDYISISTEVLSAARGNLFESWRVALHREQMILTEISAGYKPRDSNTIGELLSRGLLVQETNNHPTPYAELFGQVIREHTQRDTNITIGDILLNRYKILNIVGTTNHSQVFKAFDFQLERDIAIKVLFSNETQSNDSALKLYEMLLRGARITAKLNHPNIGQVYDVINEPLGIVMQWIDGVSLDDIVSYDEQPLSTIQIVDIGINLAKTLAYVHELNIIHRDIKPSNIILKENGTPILIDFDIARAADFDTLTNQSQGGFAFIGSPNQSAPEQFLSPDNVGSPADLFALGIVLYQLLTFRRPYNSNDPRKYDEQILPIPKQSNIPTVLYSILCTILCQNPEDRPSAKKLHLDLESCRSFLIGDNHGA